MKMQKASINDCKLYAKIIKERQDWFLSIAHPQWNDITKYYHEEYFLSKINNFYSFYEENTLVGGCFIFFEDKYWTDNKPSIYLHTFATTPKQKGIGKKAFELIVDSAKEYYSIRIDCMGSNEKLINIYKNYGFEIVGWDKYNDGQSACLMEYKIKQKN